MIFLQKQHKCNSGDDQSINISVMHFEGKPPNLMTVNFSHYMVYKLLPADWLYRV